MEVFTGTGQQLSRIQALEQDEIVWCLTERGATIVCATVKLGLSWVTMYRKIVQDDIRASVRM